MELPEYSLEEEHLALKTPYGLRRRSLLAAGAALAASAVVAPAAAHAVGAVHPPLPLPSLPATLSDGRRVDLRSWLPGKATALQFMFTTCGTTCPLLGAVFAATQQQLLSGAHRDDWQLLSVSVDVLGDSTQRLADWLKRFGAADAWHAALPDPRSSTALDALRTLGSGGAERDQHEAGILLIDRKGRLVYRLDELPDARVLARALLQIASA